MSRAVMDLYAEELQSGEPADPEVLEWMEIVQGFRRLAVAFAITFGAAAVLSIAIGGR